MNIEKNKLKNIILVGASGSGKSTLAKHLSDILGISSVEVGSIVIRFFERQSKKNKPVDFADYYFSAGKKLRFVEALLNEYPPSNSPYIIVGPRLLDELHFLKRHYKPSISFGLRVSLDIRKQRWKNRATHRLYDETFDDWIERDEIEQRWGIEDTLSSCDHIISNDGTKKQALELVKSIYKR